MKLSELEINKTGIVKRNNNSKEIAKRFQDLGITSNTRIIPILNSPSGKIRAYYVKDTLLAIRDQEAENIEIS